MPFLKVPISLAEIQSFHPQLFFSLVFFWFFSGELTTFDDEIQLGPFETGEMGPGVVTSVMKSLCYANIDNSIAQDQASPNTPLSPLSLEFHMQGE